MDDPALLKRYTQTRDESAFTELVQRHLGLVYHTALRRLNGDAHHAHDVSQTVFTLLARKAPSLLRHPTLTGWLHATANNTARDLIRTEQRRIARENETHAMEDKLSSTSSDESWQQLRPVIDDALAELKAADRDALLLRYFEDRPLSQVALSLQLSEDAARMKVNRALEKLREALSKRGVTSTAAALASVLTPHVSAAPPVGIALNISSTALAAASLSATGNIALLTLEIMKISKTTIALTVLATATTVATVYQTSARHRAEAALPELHAQHDALTKQVSTLEAQLRTAEKRSQEAERDNELLLKAAESSAPALAAAAVKNEPVTRVDIDARYKRAQTLIKSGQYEAAMKDLLWCFDVGMKQVSSFSAVRTSYVVGMLSEIGRNYPPALDALRDRRETAMATFQRDRSDTDSLAEIAAINHGLGEGARTLALFDSLAPEEKQQRTALKFRVADPLIEARRYKDLTQVQSYRDMSTRFTITTSRLDNLPEKSRTGILRETITIAAKNFEALAGAGETANAKAFLGQITAVDSSPETKALLQQHLRRSGNTEIILP